jgi:hypothetical protein
MAALELRVITKCTHLRRVRLSPDWQTIHCRHQKDEYYFHKMTAAADPTPGVHGPGAIPGRLGVGLGVHGYVAICHRDLESLLGGLHKVQMNGTSEARAGLTRGAMAWDVVETMLALEMAEVCYDKTLQVAWASDRFERGVRTKRCRISLYARQHYRDALALACSLASRLPNLRPRVEASPTNYDRHVDPVR